MFVRLDACCTCECALTADSTRAGTADPVLSSKGARAPPPRPALRHEEVAVAAVPTSGEKGVGLLLTESNQSSHAKGNAMHACDHALMKKLRCKISSVITILEEMILNRHSLSFEFQSLHHISRYLLASIQEWHPSYLTLNAHVQIPWQLSTHS